MKYLGPGRLPLAPRSAIAALVIGCVASAAPAQNDRPSPGAGNIPSATASPAPVQQALGRTEADETPAPAASPSPATTAPVDSRPGYWGLAVQPLGDTLRAQLKGVLGDRTGLVVVEVETGSPAANAGLRPHDVIVAVEGEPPGSPREFVTRVRKLAPGRDTQITIIREAKTQEMTLSTAALPKSVTRRPTHEPSRDSDWDEVQDVRIEKVVPEKLSVRVSFVDDRGTSTERTFTGTRAEIQSQVLADPELSSSRRSYVLHAMRSLTQGIVPDPFQRSWPFRAPYLDRRLSEIHAPWTYDWPPPGLNQEEANP